MTNKAKGFCMAAISAFIFGFTSILAKMSYGYGNTPATLTFLRAFLAIPILAFLTKRKGLPLRISAAEWKDMLLVGIFGSAATTLLLYASYEYIPVGVATTLHFLFPVTVTLAGILFFHAKVTRWELIALPICVLGVALLADQISAVEIKGVLMALTSTITYAIYLTGVQHSCLKDFYHFKLSLYICIISSVVSGVVGLLNGSLSFQIEPMGWLLTVPIALSVSIGAITLLQAAVTYIGAPKTAILSNLEPITSVVMGVLFLQEAMTAFRAAGCILILFGVFVSTLKPGSAKKTEQKKTEP